MTDVSVLVLATTETKLRETEFLVDRLSSHGVSARVIDTSLATDGQMLGGAEKLRVMDQIVSETLRDVSTSLDDGVHAVLGLGGGTGGEIALRVMRGLPITFPKVLVTTMPFDPRFAVADSSIIIVPTLADISGLNATLREVLENAAALTAGLCSTKRRASACVDEASIAITGLGATEGAVKGLVAALSARGQESTVFHSNGFGGAAFARFARRGAFRAIVDLTPHEVTRLCVAGAHVPMPDRFSVAPELPRVLLPGGVNFVGLGEKSLVRSEYLERPHYEHSSYFTHAKLTVEEMEIVAGELAKGLNLSEGPSALIIPMGGFSHQDCPGGAIEDPDLREVFRAAVSSQLNSNVRIETINAHICDPETTTAIMSMLDLTCPNETKGAIQ